MPPAANEYANFLLAKIARIESKDTEVKAYLALKHFIDTNSTTLKSFDMSSDILKDKEDKIADRARNFFRDLGGYLKDLKEMRRDLTEEEISEAEAKFIKSSGSSIEEMITNGDI